MFEVTYDENQYIILGIVIIIQCYYYIRNQIIRNKMINEKEQKKDIVIVFNIILFPFIFLA